MYEVKSVKSFLLIRQKIMTIDVDVTWHGASKSLRLDSKFSSPISIRE